MLWYSRTYGLDCLSGIFHPFIVRNTYVSLSVSLTYTFKLRFVRFGCDDKEAYPKVVTSESVHNSAWHLVLRNSENE